MKAVVFAAGEGTRMRPLTASRPKVMLPIANRPILEHLLIEAREGGVGEFIFVIGYCDEQVRAYFGHGEKWGVAISYCQQRRQLGTADALKMAEGRLEGDFLVMNGDVIVSRDDIKKLAGGRGNAMSLYEVDDPRGLGMVEVAGGKVVRIHEKTENPPSRLANAGLYRFTPEIFKAIQLTPPSPRGEYEITDSLQLLMEAGHPLAAREISYWLDISYPWDILTVNAKLLEELRDENQGEVEPGAVLKGPVAVGKGTVIRSGSYIVGPVVIGEGCDIGPNCFIRPATAIADGCHVGAASEVKNSVVMKGSKIPHQNYVGDSVIGEDCNLGAGTKIANLRLDKKNITAAGVDTGRRKLGAIIGDGVQTGINVSINIGGVIGDNSFIGPGAVVSGVVLPDTKIL